MRREDNNIFDSFGRRFQTPARTSRWPSRHLSQLSRNITSLLTHCAIGYHRGGDLSSSFTRAGAKSHCDPLTRSTLGTMYFTMLCQTKATAIPHLLNTNPNNAQGWLRCLNHLDLPDGSVTVVDASRAVATGNAASAQRLYLHIALTLPASSPRVAHRSHRKSQREAQPVHPGEAGRIRSTGHRHRNSNRRDCSDFGIEGQ